MTTLSVVIVNYRSMDHTANCVASVHEAARTDGLAVDIVVVNNGDNAELLAGLIEKAGGAHILEPGANLGFGAACNLGAANTEAPLMLFLNPDATVEPGALHTLTGYMASHEDVGIAGPQIVDGSGEMTVSCSRLPTPGDLIARTAGLHLLARDTGYPYLPRAQQVTGPVGQVMGAALMIRRSVFEALNGFEPRLFLYYEDVDLCARAAQFGSACHYVADAKVRHIGRVSSGSNRAAALAHHIQSRITYAGLHFGGGWQVAVALVSVAVELPLRLVQGVMRQSDLSPSQVITGYRQWLFGSSS